MFDKSDDPIIGLVVFLLLIFAYLIGVKKQTSLISGYNLLKISDPDAFASLIGFSTFLMVIFVFGTPYLGRYVTIPDTLLALSFTLGMLSPFIGFIYGVRKYRRKDR